jgi:hypothetical protein
MVIVCELQVTCSGMRILAIPGMHVLFVYSSTDTLLSSLPRVMGAQQWSGNGVQSALATRGFAFCGFNYSLTQKYAVQYSTHHQDLHSSFVLCTCILYFYYAFSLFL